MPTFNWQLIIALVCVAAAVFSLVRRAFRLFFSTPSAGQTSGCGSCGGCKADSTTSGNPPLVTLDGFDSPRLG
jgi:hypothetical protein